ncbi:hypothetical protein Tco_0195996 [Tanacetum coccineum]
MVRTEFGRMITKDIEDMTIAEYMEYEAEIKRNPWDYAKSYTRNSESTNLGESKILENKHQPDKLKTNDYFPSFPSCFKPTRPLTNDIHEPLEKDPNDCQLSTPNFHYETKEVSSDEDVDDWLNAEMNKHMIGKDKEEEDALIDILKIVVEESGINMMLKSIFEHLKLTNLKKTSMVVEMADMTKKGPIRNWGKYPNRCFQGEISLGIGNEKVKFDTNGEICHSRVPHEKIYMASSIQTGEYFNPYEVESDDSLPLEQRTLHYSEESIDTVDSSDDSQEDEVGSHLSKDVGNRMKFADFLKVRHRNKNIDDITHERQYYEWVAQNYDFNIKTTKMGKENFDFEGNFERTRDNPYSRNFKVYKEEFDDEIKQLENEYELKAGRKRYALEEVWEKCEKFHDSTKLWYDKGFEEEEL